MADMCFSWLIVAVVVIVSADLFINVVVGIGLWFSRRMRSKLK